MQAFLIEAPNKPGEFSRVTEAIAEKGINITGMAATTCGDTGSAVLLTNDEQGTRRCLSDNHVKYREIEVVAAQLADSPGSLNEAVGRLGRAGINIEATLAMGMSGGSITVAFATNNPSRAREVLGQGVLTGTTRGR